MAGLPDTFVPNFHDENEVRKMTYHTLGETGLKVSNLSLGTGGFSHFYGEYTIDECKATVLEALKKGINFIDTAPWYGHGISEEIVGKCLKDIPRQAYYIATKVGRYEKDPKLMFDFSASKIKESVDTSLKRLGVGYIDLIQVHDVEFAPSLDVIINETLPALEEIVKSGKAKHIGITGYPVSQLVECIKKSSVKIETILSYTRMTMIDHTLKEFLPFLKSRNIGVINAAAHAMGLLSNVGPQSWHPASEHIKDVCTEARNYCKERSLELGRLAIYHSFEQKGPATQLVGMNNRHLLKANLDVCYSGLSKEEKDAYDHIMNKIFNKLTVNHWETVEVTNYWKILSGDESAKLF